MIVRFPSMQPPPAPQVRPTHVRHAVLGMTVAIYMITYMDRSVISVATPSIMQELAIPMGTMGVILSLFRWGYALFQVPGGLLGDRIGPRRALSVIVAWWSAFTALTGMAWNAVGMGAVRFLFGIGEAGAFPIATRSLSRWMLASERGFAQGITHAGSRLGAAITPPVVVAIIAAFGWRAAFFLFGALGLLWTIVWFFWYRDTPDEHTWVNQAELQLIHGGSIPPKQRPTNVPWRRILSSSTLWFLCAMYFFYNYTLNTYIDWFPTYLVDARGMNLAEMGFYASLPLLAGVAGDLLGGWCSDIVLGRTGRPNLARRWVAIAGFLTCAASTVPAALVESAQVSVAFYCLAFFSLEWTVGISWAVPLDIGGDFAGSVAAFMNMCGNIGGALSPIALAALVEAFDWYVPFLVTAGLCVLASLLYLKVDASKRIA